MPGAIFGFPTRPTTGQGMVWSETLGGASRPGTFTLTGANLSGFGDNRLAFGSATGGLEDSASLTFDGTAFVVAGAIAGTSLTASGLTSGRVPFVTTGGLLTDAADLAYNSTTHKLTVGDGTTTTGFIFNGAAGSAKDFNYRVGGLDRWVLRVTGAEGGGDAGSTWSLRAYTDAGAIIDTPLTIVRAAGGLATLTRPLSVTSATASTTTTTGALIVAGGVGVAGQVSAATLLASGLTSGRVPFATTGGLLTDNAGLTYVSNVLTMGDGTSGARQSINGAAAQVRRLTFQTASVQRWEITCNESAESGSSAGSNFRIRASDDAGTTIDDPLSISRVAGGAMTVVRPLAVTSTTASTTTTTGALVVAGGVGVAGAMNVGGALAVTGAITATAGVSCGTGNLAVDGAGGRVHVGRIATSITSTADAYVGWLDSAFTGSPTSGSLGLWARNTAGADMRFYVAGALAVTVATGGMTVASTTASSSTTTGALVVAGGVGVAGAMNVGSSSVATGIAATASTVGATMTVSDAGTTNQPFGLYVDHTSSGTPAAGFGVSLGWRAKSDTTNSRIVGQVLAQWAVATDASRTGRLRWFATDATADREFMRGEASGSAAMIGFLGAAATVRTAITGSRGGNAALAALLTELAAKGLITDSTTA